MKVNRVFWFAAVFFLEESSGVIVAYRYAHWALGDSGQDCKSFELHFGSLDGYQSSQLVS